MFQRFSDSFRRFMYGRYGSDKLNFVMLIAVLAISLVNSILRLIFRSFFVYTNIINPILSVLTLLLLGFAIFRMFSRNIYARQKENRAFERLFSRLKDKEHRYYRCPSCKQTVRVPKGRGKINITCPKCGTKFMKKA